MGRRRGGGGAVYIPACYRRRQGTRSACRGFVRRGNRRKRRAGSHVRSHHSRNTASRNSSQFCPIHSAPAAPYIPDIGDIPATTAPATRHARHARHTTHQTPDTPSTPEYPDTPRTSDTDTPDTTHQDQDSWHSCGVARGCGSCHVWKMRCWVKGITVNEVRPVSCLLSYIDLRSVFGI